jgi:hypothetical protein
MLREQVQRNKGAPDVDGMTIDKLVQRFHETDHMLAM